MSPPAKQQRGGWAMRGALSTQSTPTPDSAPPPPIWLVSDPQRGADADVGLTCHRRMGRKGGGERDAGVRKSASFDHGLAAAAAGEATTLPVATRESSASGSATRSGSQNKGTTTPSPAPAEGAGGPGGHSSPEPERLPRQGSGGHPSNAVSAAGITGTDGVRRDSKDEVGPSRRHSKRLRPSSSSSSLPLAPAGGPAGGGGGV